MGKKSRENQGPKLELTPLNTETRKLVPEAVKTTFPELAWTYRVAAMSGAGAANRPSKMPLALLISEGVDLENVWGFTQDDLPRQCFGVLCPPIPLHEDLAVRHEELISFLRAEGADEIMVFPLGATGTREGHLIFDLKAAGCEPDRVEHMLKSSTLVEEISQDIDAIGVAGEEDLALLLYVAGTSRLLKKPLAVIVQGDSSSGKSHVVSKVASLFPPTAVLQAHSMTPQALINLPEDALEHRFVVAGERSQLKGSQAAEATRGWRDLISDGKLTRQTAHGRKEVNGPIAYVESTTQTEVFSEDRNRCLLVNPDMSAEQTARIQARMAEAKLRKRGKDAEVSIRAKHHMAQTMLKRCDVAIPFSQVLEKHFPKDKVEYRRLFSHVLSVIEAVTLLNQYQRTGSPADGIHIEATRQDYIIARCLLSKVWGTAKQPVEDAAGQLLARVRRRMSGKVFTSVQVSNADGLDQSSVREHLKTLVARGELVEVSKHRGRTPATYRIAEAGKGGRDWLPHPDLVCPEPSGD